MKTVYVGGVKINCGKREELLLGARALVGRGGCIFTPNPAILSLAEENAEYKRVLNLADMNIPDGVGVKYILKRRGVFTDVFPGVELGELLVCGNRFAIIGGVEGRAELAGKRLCESNPNARFCFAHAGYGYDEEYLKKRIRECDADICFVCLGAPWQELLAHRLYRAVPKTLFIALGGSVDVYSGAVKRAPRIMRRLSLEWLYRCIKEPRRIRRLPGAFSFFIREFFTD